ncbi:hypothetical protein CA850_16315 [Micromonospora echinospora]|uniref:tyrosine-type recombinase/integrase n=1 Tax=Micromonospora echinospora TaxID=1877 RepID=UPI000BD11AE8|nr:tyrosine-type recombinase/integrase [Micromonospora echinospora]OZV79637.1 hypothetical protein CA850_16315 [Micromonospora echinospora]
MNRSATRTSASSIGPRPSHLSAFHDLRHSYATWLITDGSDVARVMGHEQISTTLDRYTYTYTFAAGAERVRESFAGFSLTTEQIEGAEGRQGSM